MVFPIFFTFISLQSFSQVFRCWIIYSRQYLIILPSFTLFLVDLAMAIKLIQIHANPHVTPDINVITPWWLSFLALTAAQNTLTTRTSFVPIECSLENECDFF